MRSARSSAPVARIPCHAEPPATRVQEVRGRDDEDQLVAHASSSTSATRAPANRDSRSSGIGALQVIGPAGEDRLQVGQPCRDLRGVRREDSGTHRRVAPREPRHARPAAGRELAGRRPVRRRDHRFGQCRREEQWQVADGRDGAIVICCGHADRPAAAGRHEGRHPRFGVVIRRIRRDDDPRPVREQSCVGRPVAGRLSAGQRVPADEAESGPGCTLHDRTPSYWRRR